MTVVSDRYTAVATSRTPALLIYLIDVSGSMGDPFENSTKIDYVNRALWRALQRMVQRSAVGAVITPRYRLAMAAYSDTIIDIFGGVREIATVAAKGEPIFSPTNTAKAALAFEWARDV